MRKEDLCVKSIFVKSGLFYFKFLVVFWFLYLANPALVSGQATTRDTVSYKDLFGIWQLNSAAIGSGLNKNFRFYEDRRFVFTYGGSDYDGQLLNVGGRYRIDSGYLYLSIEYRTEVFGGHLMPGLDGVIGAEFVIVDGETKVVKQTISNEINPFRLTRCGEKTAKTMQCVKIEYKKYYKLSSDPDAYR